MYKDKGFEDQIRKIIESGFKYQNLFYGIYRVTFFSISQNHDLDYVKFDPRFKETELFSFDRKKKTQEEFESLIKNNKIDLVNDSNFTNLYNNQRILWELILYSIELDSYEFVNLLLGKSLINKCRLLRVGEIYKMVTILVRK
jgi:hypothetical protein